MAKLVVKCSPGGLVPPHPLSQGVDPFAYPGGGQSNRSPVLRSRHHRDQMPQAVWIPGPCAVGAPFLATPLPPHAPMGLVQASTFCCDRTSTDHNRNQPTSSLPQNGQKIRRGSYRTPSFAPRQLGPKPRSAPLAPVAGLARPTGLGRCAAPPGCTHRRGVRPGGKSQAKTPAPATASG